MLSGPAAAAVTGVTLCKSPCGTVSSAAWVPNAAASSPRDAASPKIFPSTASWSRARRILKLAAGRSQQQNFSRRPNDGAAAEIELQIWRRCAFGDKDAGRRHVGQARQRDAVEAAQDRPEALSRTTPTPRMPAPATEKPGRRRAAKPAHWRCWSATLRLSSARRRGGHRATVAFRTAAGSAQSRLAMTRAAKARPHDCRSSANIKSRSGLSGIPRADAFIKHLRPPQHNRRSAAARVTRHGEFSPRCRAASPKLPCR